MYDRYRKAKKKGKQKLVYDGSLGGKADPRTREHWRRAEVEKRKKTARYRKA